MDDNAFFKWIQQHARFSEPEPVHVEGLQGSVFSIAKVEGNHQMLFSEGTRCSDRRQVHQRVEGRKMRPKTRIRRNETVCPLRHRRNKDHWIRLGLELELQANG